MPGGLKNILLYIHMFFVHGVTRKKVYYHQKKGLLQKEVLVIFRPEKVEFLATLYYWSKDLTFCSFLTTTTTRFNMVGYYIMLHKKTLKLLNVNPITQQLPKITISIALAMPWDIINSQVNAFEQLFMSYDGDVESDIYSHYPLYWKLRRNKARVATSWNWHTQAHAARWEAINKC